MRAQAHRADVSAGQTFARSAPIRGPERPSNYFDHHDGCKSLQTLALPAAYWGFRSGVLGVYDCAR
jgi:hypothetical protein